MSDVPSELRVAKSHEWARLEEDGAKLADHFRLPSVRHYLLVRTERQTVIHHRRADDGDIQTRIVTAGTLTLYPPGLQLALAHIHR